MRINSDHRSWIVATGATALAAGAAYWTYAAAAPYGPSGGSWPGIFFGIAGTICMVIPALFAVRKKMRVRRIGSAQLWMRMHIWLSLLAVPLIWFHSGFELGGALTRTLMILFYVVTLSGIAGLVLQQFLPAIMTARVPLETLYNQIDYVIEGLATDAYEVVAAIAGSIPEAAQEQARLAAEEALQKARPGDWKQISRQRPASAPLPGATELKQLYLTEIRPYLWRRSAEAPPDLGALRVQAPEEWRAKVDRLAAICEEARQLAVQARLHRWLHNWLYLHAPLSFAMFALAACHIVFALRY